MPPFSRESEASTCWKRPKIDSSLSAGMPRPASLTSKIASSPSRLQDTRTLLPAGENLTALLIRFVSV